MLKSTHPLEQRIGDARLYYVEGVGIKMCWIQVIL